MTIWVIGNCQARGVAKSVESLTKSSDVRPLDIRTIMQADEAGKARLASQVQKSDILLIQKPDDHAGPFSIENLRAAGYRAVAFPSFGFSGFHPDLCYIKCNGTYISGPMFSYHSSIVAGAYIEGLSQERACALFNTFTYASLGYRNVYNSTLPILNKHIAETGHDHSAALSRGVFMHTINHPHIEILFDVAKHALFMAGIPTHGDAAYPADELGQSFVWPVYPGISRTVPGSLEFQVRAGETLNLHEFVSKSYDCYGILADGYEAIRVDKAREFIQRELIKPKVAA